MHLSDEERLKFFAHDTQDDTHFALVFDEVQALVKGRKAYVDCISNILLLMLLLLLLM